jgi:hypothetical protein
MVQVFFIENIFMRLVFLFSVLISAVHVSYGQGCCSGGSGSPIAGGGSVGVLAQQQMELSTSFQYTYSDKFLIKNRDTLPLFDHFNSKYLYYRLAYGITKQFTFSVEGGYYLNKTQIGLRDPVTGIPIDSLSSSGIADLILFPKYNLLDRSDSSRKVELTLGLGYKIPLGKYNDSSVVFHNPFTGQDVYAIMPPLVQPTNGSQDFIFYGLFLRGFPQHHFKLFTNVTYIKKGWNPLGYKYGDYAGVGVFASKTFFKNLGVTLQVKGEWVDSIHYNENIDLVALYNIYTSSTGSKKISLIPQVSYSYKNFTIYGLKDFPLYEYVNGTQMKTQTLWTLGLSYRFFTTKSPVCENPDANSTYWECPMKCEGLKYNGTGKCKKCGMDLIKP